MFKIYLFDRVKLEIFFISSVIGKGLCFYGNEYFFNFRVNILIVFSFDC